jgi:hypothetical protein
LAAWGGNRRDRLLVGADLIGYRLSGSRRQWSEASQGKLQASYAAPVNDGWH